MSVEINMRTRDGFGFAEALYSNGKVRVKAGGRVHPKFNGQKKIKSIRDNKSVVDEDGNILADIDFSSASAAAQFINGNISNGLRVWKTNGETLGEYIEKHK